MLGLWKFLEWKEGHLLPGFYMYQKGSPKSIFDILRLMQFLQSENSFAGLHKLNPGILTNQSILGKGRVLWLAMGKGLKLV